MRTEKTPGKADWDRAEQRAKPRRKRCGACGEEGHTIRTCPMLERRRQGLI